MKTAVITGITSGIGQAIKLRLEAEHWRVLGISRHLPAEQEGYEADLVYLEGLNALADRIKADCPTIDAFIHVAGVWHDKQKALTGMRLHEFNAEQIISTVNVGLTSAMLLSARLLDNIPDHGALVYISGRFQDGGADWLPYYTSKRALEDFVVGLSHDESRIRAFGVSPADTATESYRQFHPGKIDTAQSPLSVAKVCLDLINGTLPASSGTIVEVEDGKPGMGYHR